MMRSTRWLGIAIAASGVATALLRRRLGVLNRAVGKYHDALFPNNQQLEALKRDFEAQLAAGLASDVDVDGTHMLMLPTYVTRMPTGNETGDVYALDMGGTNVRIMYVHLGDAPSAIDEVDIDECAIPREVYTGSGTQLFDFLARHVANFMHKHGGCSNTKAGRLPTLGLCFSFPMRQTALNAGILLDWTKGFTCDGVVGNDPVVLLQAALLRSGVTCNCTVLLNDTVGVLAAQRYLDPDTSIGVVLGTGTNVCYVEKVSRVSKWVLPTPPPPGAETTINVEWGAFESEHLPRCAEDWDIDAATLHKGKYMFEKLLSGMFLGEIARRILLSLARDPSVALFGTGAPHASTASTCAPSASSSDPAATPPPNGPAPTKRTEVGAPGVPAALTCERGFPSSALAACVADRSLALQGVARALREHLGVEGVSRGVRVAVRQVCCMVAQRSATLTAAGVHCLLRHTGFCAEGAHKRTVVAFDGGVYEQFAEYRVMLRRSLQTQMGKQGAALVEFTLAHDGSCLGAAVLAAAAAEQGVAALTSSIVNVLA